MTDKIRGGFSVAKDSTSGALIIIFGATGDLAQRKLFPSLYKLFTADKFGENMALVGVARRPLATEEFRNFVRQALVETSEPNDEKAEQFLKRAYYYSLDVRESESYQGLKALLDDLDRRYGVPGNRLFYLSMAPEFFGPIVSNLQGARITPTRGWNRVVIEKPFGHDLASARYLNTQIRQVFEEDQIYRIDHYLGKEMVQNIEVIRFANSIFEPLWNNRYIANIQITSSETLGVEDRGRYYEKSGALRDMVQNHMLQLVALMAMEPPIRLSTEEVRSEKIKVLKALRLLEADEVNQCFVRGQYAEGSLQGKELPRYREEKYVHPESIRETFVAGKMMIDNFRWAGVPFYIRTGKRLSAKATKIVVQFKTNPMNLYNGGKGGKGLEANLLVIHINPDEGISLHLNVKSSEHFLQTIPIKLEYCNICQGGMNTPEAYERLLNDCLRGDTTNFSHWDEVAWSWQFIDRISAVWENDKPLDFPNYSAGSTGPQASDQLLARDGFHWWPVINRIRIGKEQAKC